MQVSIRVAGIVSLTNSNSEQVCFYVLFPQIISGKTLIATSLPDILIRVQNCYDLMVGKEHWHLNIWMWFIGSTNLL